jgi:hypothetical protein
MRPPQRRWASAAVSEGRLALEAQEGRLFKRANPAKTKFFGQPHAVRRVAHERSAKGLARLLVGAGLGGARRADAGALRPH